MHGRWLATAAITIFATSLVLSAAARAQGGDKSNPTVSSRIAKLKSAATAGQPEAAYALAQAYAFGRGVPRSMELARDWFETAARHGHVAAMINLAAIHYHGIGVQVDLALAYAWFELAAAFGSTIALYNLIEVERRIGSDDRTRGVEISRTVLPQILAVMPAEQVAHARDAARKMLTDPTARRLIAVLNSVRLQRNRIDAERLARGPLPTLTPIRPDSGRSAD